MSVPSIQETHTHSSLYVMIKKLPHAANLPLPQYATVQSAGMDLLAAIQEPIVLMPGKPALIPSGICIALPEGHEAQIRSRSGLAAKHGVIVLNAPGTIDADYRGEIMGIMMNCGTEPFVIEPAMRFAQMVVAPYTRVTWDETTTLEETSRGQGGFGSTGLT